MKFVKVTKAGLPTYWYANQIGTVYKVVEYDADHWSVVDGSNECWCIGKEDAQFCDMYGDPIYTPTERLVRLENSIRKILAEIEELKKVI